MSLRQKVRAAYLAKQQAQGTSQSPPQQSRIDPPIILTQRLSEPRRQPRRPIPPKKKGALDTLEELSQFLKTH
jgi:hypothetical protein